RCFEPIWNRSSSPMLMRPRACCFGEGRLLRDRGQGQHLLGRDSVEQGNGLEDQESLDRCELRR
ncbi:MAG: hypothetical protein ACRD1Z_03430, partial [Vicinamibacteria bacterium]